MRGNKTMSNTYADALTKTVDVNGTSFTYRETGQKNGIPVVLLHHLTAGLDDWDPRTIDSLAQKHRVIVFNNRGVGGSKGTTPDTIDDMATDAVAFIRALGLRKTDLLGFSLGGFIAQVIAQKHPGRHFCRRRRWCQQRGRRIAERRGQGNSREKASEAVALFHTVP